VFGAAVLQEEDQIGYTMRLTEVDIETKESILRWKVFDHVCKKLMFTEHVVVRKDSVYFSSSDDKPE